MTPEIELMNQFIAKVDYYKHTLLKPIKDANVTNEEELQTALHWVIATDLAIKTGLGIESVLEFLKHVNLEELLKL